MAETKKVSAADIKELMYCDTSLITADLTGTLLYNLLNPTTGADKPVKIPNIHGTTFTIEEGESSQDSYKDQLTGQIYRFGKKTIGDITMKFTIGQYDYALKAKFLGGSLVGTNGWKRSRESSDIKMAMIALTYDDQYCVFPCAQIKANESNADSAVGIAVTATAILPSNNAISPEYWFDKSEVAKSA